MSSVGNPVHTLALTDSTASSSSSNKALNDEQIYQWISELVTGNNRERALLELGKKREQYDDLALVLWNLLLLLLLMSNCCT